VSSADYQSKARTAASRVDNHAVNARRIKLWQSMQKQSQLCTTS